MSDQAGLTTTPKKLTLEAKEALWAYLLRGAITVGGINVVAIIAAFIWVSSTVNQNVEQAIKEARVEAVNAIKSDREVLSTLEESLNDSIVFAKAMGQLEEKMNSIGADLQSTEGRYGDFKEESERAMAQISKIKSDYRKTLSALEGQEKLDEILNLVARISESDGLLNLEKIEQRISKVSASYDHLRQQVKRNWKATSGNGTMVFVPTEKSQSRFAFRVGNTTMYLYPQDDESINDGRGLQARLPSKLEKGEHEVFFGWKVGEDDTLTIQGGQGRIFTFANSLSFQVKEYDLKELKVDGDFAMTKEPIATFFVE